MTNQKIEVEIHGTRVSFEGRGTGYPTVLIHGFASDSSTWDGVWDSLCEARHCVRYDLRGFGRSAAKGDGPYDHAADLRIILDRLGIERCDLVGTSMGGAVALNFALDEPDMVRRLVLAGPTLVGWEWSSAWNDAWSAIVSAAVSGDMQAARELWFNHELFKATRANQAARTALRSATERYEGQHWSGDNRSIVKAPDVERLHLLDAPTLLLTGDRDLEELRLVSDVIEAACPDLERVDIPDCGHLIHLERSALFSRTVTSFLTRG